METALMLAAWTLFVGTTSGLLWWRLAPAHAGDSEARAVGFEGGLRRWTAPVPPRPDEIQWYEDDDGPTGWVRLARGVGLLLLIIAAGTVLASLVYMGGKYVIHQIIAHFGVGLGR